jgi:predicted metal-dependent phosphoesterase TrpH
VPRATLTPEDAITLIHRAGGIAALAHPGKLGDPIRILRRLQGAGLDALEAYHSDHTPAVTERLLRWANQFNLAVTGGTDSHGPHGPRRVEIGSIPVPDWVGEQLLALLAK